MRRIEFRREAAALAVFAMIFSPSAQAGNPMRTLDIPNAGTQRNQGSFPASINANSVIAGWYADGSNVNHGFSA